MNRILHQNPWLINGRYVWAAPERDPQIGRKRARLRDVHEALTAAHPDVQWQMDPGPATICIQGVAVLRWNAGDGDLQRTRSWGGIEQIRSIEWQTVVKDFLAQMPRR